jgi:hypothetical protein
MKQIIEQLEAIEKTIADEIVKGGKAVTPHLLAAKSKARMAITSLNLHLAASAEPAVTEPTDAAPSATSSAEPTSGSRKSRDAAKSPTK